MGGCLSAVVAGVRDMVGGGDAAAARRALGGSRMLVIGHGEYKVLRTIGEGGYSFVHLCRDGVGTEVAVKQTIVDASDPDASRRVIAEAEYLRDLPRHPNIIRYQGHAVRAREGQGKREVLLVMELCPGTLLGEMREHLQAGTRYTTPRALTIFADVLAGVAHLHSQKPPISHRDLKVENVLIGRDGRYKLCDLGSATTLSFECRTRLDVAAAEEDIEQNTTLMCRAPEQIDLWQKKRVGPPVDVWALGVVLFYVCFLEAPFEAQTLQILNCKYTMPAGAEEQVGAGVVDLIRAIFVPDPADRPDVWAVSERLVGLLPDHSRIQRPRAH
eukprot:TRINITY_DN44512_c0_g1_i1.p2 TRINITY_DN44512_c0_g1~~TRINITY_DN44512_c0_g1_i1.p2  ORF type:complete len:356 (+),score=90.58 TRINITY_DN44512_c0_g1_i1:83-1069(+)